MTTTIDGKRLYEFGRGDTGVIYRIMQTDLEPDDPLSNMVIKYPVDQNENELAFFWADKNCNADENYSASPFKEVQFFIKPGKVVIGLQMTYVGDTTYADRSHNLSVGETVLLYLMLVHCTLRLSGIMLSDTAESNCLCQGKEYDFTICLIDTHEWTRSMFESYVVDNFRLICRKFDLLLKPALLIVRPFMESDIYCERTFLDAMLKSCDELCNQFLRDTDVEDASAHCYYQERIDKLMCAIAKDTSKALMQLQAFEALDAA